MTLLRASARLSFCMLLPAAALAQWTPQSVAFTGELRGLSVLSPAVAWASGVRGTVLHTVDGGRTWRVDSVPGAAKLDLRAVAATSASVAHALSIGDSSRIFRTRDGGRTWSERFISLRKGSFFDAIQFWDAKHGIAVSDPVDGRFLLVTTDDGGDTWKEVPTDHLPLALAGEGAFAASGSCLTVFGSRDVWFVTGGAASARVFHSADRGKTWSVSDTPLRAGVAAAGGFSVAFHTPRRGIVVGGDYTQAKLGGRNVALTMDGGATWTLVDSARGPQGFKSAVSYVPGSAGRSLVAVGLNGTDVSRDGGMSWVSVDTMPYNSVLLAGKTGYAVGPKGRVAKYTGARGNP